MPVLYLDNRLLLQSAKEVDCRVAQGQDRPAYDELASLLERNIAHDDLAILWENELVRQMLIEALERDTLVWDAQLKLKKKTYGFRIFNKPERELQQRLKELIEARDHAWSEYETIRRLVCYNNEAIIVRRS